MAMAAPNTALHYSNFMFRFLIRFPKFEQLATFSGLASLLEMGGAN